MCFCQMPPANLNAQHTWIRPWLYKKQELAIFSPARYSCIEASTKAGKTVSALIWLTEQAILGRDGQNFWWVAPTYKQAEIAYRRAKKGLPKNVYTSNEAKITLTLVNGARMNFLSAERPDGLYGEDVYAAVVDEASRVREEAWFAIRSTLTATRGPVRLIGNVKGRKNWFYRICRLAQDGTPNYQYTKITAYDAVEAGVLDIEEIEDAKRALPEHVFNELFLCIPAKDAGCPFDLTAIEELVRKGISGKKTVAYGVDLAKYVDWTVIVGLDVDGNPSFFDRFQLPWTETMQRIENVVGLTPTLMDSTGVGDPILEALQRKVGSNFEGYKFTSSSKQQLIEGLSVAIQHRQIGLLAGPMQDELESFEYEYTRTGVRYTAPEGLNDDCVCALALVWYRWLHQTGGASIIEFYKSQLEKSFNNPNIPATTTPPTSGASLQVMAQPEVYAPPGAGGPFKKKAEPETEANQEFFANYKETYGSLMGEALCVKCGQLIENDRVEDGFQIWHTRCYRGW